MKRYINNKKGLTLIELLVTVAILGIVILGFLNLFVYGFTYIGMARNKSNSSVYAQSDANGYLSVNIGDNITTTDKTISTTNCPLEIVLVTGSSIDTIVDEITVTVRDKEQESTIVTIVTKD
jgi:prepilin-type N-terminal cleavage/methylation domain-containing protein